MELSSRTRFGIVFYGADAQAFRQRLAEATPKNKIAAIQFANSRALSYGTCMERGIEKSLKLILKGRARHGTVIVAGDGRPTTCPYIPQSGRLSDRELERLIARPASLNAGKRLTLHTIYVGESLKLGDIDFMKRLAKAHGGTFKLANR